MIRTQLEEEKRQKQIQREHMKKEAEESLKRKSEQRKLYKESSMIEKEEARKLMEENARKQKEKEEKYHQFFKDYESSMNERVSKHIEKAASPEQAKDKLMMDWVKKNEEEYAQRMKMRDEQLREMRRMVIFSLLNLI